MLINIGLIIVGLILLVKGGDYLIDGATAIARRAKLSPMVIGLTVVGFGTSAPEFIVSLQSALAGNSGIAIGNVVGSNIANIALILGMTAVIRPCPTSRQTLVIDAPFMVLACILLTWVGMSGSITRIPGLIGVAMLLVFVSWQVINSRKLEKQKIADAEANGSSNNEGAAPEMAWWKALLLVIISIVALVFGANWLIDGASGIASQLGVTDRVIGLTIVAVGTSLPELFASVMAARKGETDMAIGNVIGSITFNILCVIGLSAVICPIYNSNVGFAFDYFLMTALGLALWCFLGTKRLLERWEGILFLLIYVAYIARTVIMV